MKALVSGRMSCLRLRRGRQGQREHGNAVEEVLPETPLAHLLPEIAVGGRDEPEARMQLPGAAHAHEAPLLQNAQQFGLHQGRHFADLVNEQRALISHFKQADLLLERTGERAPLMPEKFALKKILDHARRMHGDERPRPPAGRVDVPGHEFLARARLAADQDGTSVTAPLAA